jgi:hypothetical protein
VTRFGPFSNTLTTLVMQLTRWEAAAHSEWTKLGEMMKGTRIWTRLKVGSWDRFLLFSEPPDTEVDAAGKTRKYIEIRSDDDTEVGSALRLYTSKDGNYPRSVRWMSGSDYLIYRPYTGGTFAFYASVSGVLSGLSARPWGCTYTNIVRLGSYTVATVPSASDYARGVIYVSDGDSGSPCLAVSNGTNWLRVALGAAVST